MCRICGCGNKGLHQHSDGTWHSHEHDHSSDHDHHHHQSHDNHSHHHNHLHNDHSKKVSIDPMISVLQRNDQIAQDNRLWFLKNKILCLNFISSPGSGKTLLLEKLLPSLCEKFKTAVLVGDQATSLDAHRLLDKGAKIKQVNTPNSCHLDAPHVSQEIEGFISPPLDLLIIENVGNLVCPAMFDLGEAAKIALISSTEGEEKPLKYPSLFVQAQAVIITKSDLIPHLNWSLEKTVENIRRINLLAPIFVTSALKHQGFEPLISWIQKQGESLNSPLSEKTVF